MGLTTLLLPNVLDRVQSNAVRVILRITDNNPILAMRYLASHKSVPETMWSASKHTSMRYKLRILRRSKKKRGVDGQGKRHGWASQMSESSMCAV